MSLDLDEIDRLAVAATPGLWSVAPYISADTREVAQVDGPGWCVADCFESERPLADAAFIAAARTAVPALVAKLRELRDIVMPEIDAELKNVRAVAEAAEARVAELRKFACHSRDDSGEWCPRHWVDEDCGEDGSVCTCGLDALKAAP